MSAPDFSKMADEAFKLRDNEDEPRELLETIARHSYLLGLAAAKDLVYYKYGPIIAESIQKEIDEARK